LSGRVYTLEEAQAMLPEARTRITEVAALVADLHRLLAQLRAGTAPADTVDQAAVLESAVDATFAWFDRHGVQIKSLTPALLDFRARAIRDGEPIEVLLCWRDDEDTIAYYHPPEDGYAGREPVAFLDRV
jgi:hypothetical protein